MNGTTVFDERGPQVLAYVSPNWSGFSFALAYDAHYFNDEDTYACDRNGEGDKNDDDVDVCDVDDKDDGLHSAMLMYDNAGFFASLAYKRQDGGYLMGALGNLGPIFGALTSGARGIVRAIDLDGDGIPDISNRAINAYIDACDGDADGSGGIEHCLEDGNSDAGATLSPFLPNPSKTAYKRVETGRLVRPRPSR